MTTKAQPVAPSKNAKSRILQTVSETAADLDRLGFIDKRKQKRLRLNTSASIVHKWEIRAKNPNVPSLKRPTLRGRKGLDAVL